MFCDRHLSQNGKTSRNTTSLPYRSSILFINRAFLCLKRAASRKSEVILHIKVKAKHKVRETLWSERGKPASRPFPLVSSKMVYLRSVLGRKNFPNGRTRIGKNLTFFFKTNNWPIWRIIKMRHSSRNKRMWLRDFKLNTQGKVSHCPNSISHWRTKTQAWNYSYVYTATKSSCHLPLHCSKELIFRLDSM